MMKTATSIRFRSAPLKQLSESRELLYLNASKNFPITILITSDSSDNTCFTQAHDMLNILLRVIWAIYSSLHEDMNEKYPKAANKIKSGTNSSISFYFGETKQENDRANTIIWDKYFSNEFTKTIESSGSKLISNRNRVMHTNHITSAEYKE